MLYFFRPIVFLLVIPGTFAYADPSSINYARDIQPILSSRCYDCHGPEKQKKGLRLDLKTSALNGSDEGPVIVVGDPDNSPLIKMVSGRNANRRMPPKGEPLSEEQITSLKRWIAQGAEWPDVARPISTDDMAPTASNHWAFQPIHSPPVPAVSKPAWLRNPIDAFVLAKLDSQKIAPSPEADRVTLARRLYLDLTGLPPAPMQLDTFLKDQSPLAYDSLVDRLLKSQHFGERWGRYWLDLARYADSDGYQFDRPRPFAYLYRDWVISALNLDMPFDEFTIEQLAGDLLQSPAHDQLIATGFHRNTLTNGEGGVDPEEDRAKQNIDRTGTTASVFLGLTMACAQCHSHKYDPITHREFYEFFGFFNVTQESKTSAVTETETAEFEHAKAEFDSKVAVLQKKIADFKPTLANRIISWEKNLDPAKLIKWNVAESSACSSLGGSTFTKLNDKSLVVGGKNADNDTYTIIVKTHESGIKGFRLQMLKHESFSNSGPGRAHNGNFVLSEFSVFAAPMSHPDQKQQIKLVNPKADRDVDGNDISDAFDGNSDTGWRIDKLDNEFNKDRWATFETAEPVGFPEGTVLTFVLEHHFGYQHNIGRLRLSTATVPPESIIYPDDVCQALLVPPDQRKPEQSDVILDFYGLQDPDMKQLRAPLDALLATAPKPPKKMAQTIAQNPDPPKTYIFVHGDFLLHGDEVRPNTPAFLPALHPRGDTPDRLDLARWIASPENPLTARVEVNRIWQHLFGQGIVDTPDNFGTRGELPTHPELLDWLATELIQRGWSIKAVIRLIVTSSTYRQASQLRPDIDEVDPENHLLARQNRYHVEAEVVRDLYLAASGMLCYTVGGPSIRPPQPADIALMAVSPFVKWEESPVPDRYRRSVYIFFQRSVPYPMLATFDCPDSSDSVGRRARSNTPLQALTLLNDSVFFECAQALGIRILKEGPQDDRGRICYAFRLCLGREPQSREVDRLEQFLDSQRNALSSDQVGAVQFASTQHDDAGESSKDTPELPCYTALARVIMNLDEFVTRE